ncbi:hypothetical protein CAL26_22505 [Bordetella genomosp. 9]|uniref:ABC transmembrane type-1 domain-containing protein n=2 Tax=Bordetella genomosp. 9 TaxID=1416803 RepID=A0A261R5K1_9BORD|nr:hypothetical protein CAL26_22505 [Bordetella genomosp. 9]
MPMSIQESAMNITAGKATPSRAWMQLRHDKAAWLGLAAMALLAFAAIAGPSLLGGGDTFEISMDLLAPPSWTHPMGTDDMGRSTFNQLIWGARTSLMVGLASALSTTVIGIAVGALAGYFGGWFDMVIMRVTEVFQVMPKFVLAAVVVAMAGPGLAHVILVIAVLSWPQPARLVRGEVMRIKGLEYVQAAICLGESRLRILWREVLPNAVAPVLALGTLVIGQAILLEAGLSFFGLTTPETPSWGGMLNVGQRFFHQAWWLSVFPGAAIVATVLIFNILGDSVSAAFNPRGGSTL